jgi:21S rRNA (uridine2791-2'-O)-methyltransferase
VVDLVRNEKQLYCMNISDGTQGYAPGSWSQVAVERTKPTGRIVGIDIIPAQPPKGVSTIQGNFLSPGVQAEVKSFLSDPERGRLRHQLFSHHREDATAIIEQDERSYIDSERHADDEEGGERKDPRKMVDVVLSDMYAPWEQTTGFWKRTLSDPYIRMMNTSGIAFKDHTGSMVCFSRPRALIIFALIFIVGSL